MTAARLWVVIPAYNEEAWLRSTLDALDKQTDRRFTVAIVDNGSTDDTRAIARGWCLGTDLVAHVIDEPSKGTGAAVDTGFRFAIEHGADWVARTDADALPSTNWVDRLRAHTGELRMIAGRRVARTDDNRFGALRHLVLKVTIALAETVGRVRPANRGRQYLTRFVPCSGANLAIEADLYLESGGFPRTSIEELQEDRALMNRARLVTNRIARRREVLVAVSTRRLQALGLRKTLLWYWDQRYVPPVVDIR